MNTHFRQKPVMASSGGGSGVGIPGFCLAIDGNLNYQMKRPIDNVLIEINALPLEQMNKELGKINKIQFICIFQSIATFLIRDKKHNNDFRLKKTTTAHNWLVNAMPDALHTG